MKSQLIRILSLLALGAGLPQAVAQNTAFTYQGQLTAGGNAANGSFDLTFGLFSGASGGAGQEGPTITNLAVSVTNGLFTVPLDFGANFPGANRWLEIAVRTNGGGAFTTLIPRQMLNPTPYAITAENVAPGGGVSGAYSNAVTFSNAANSFTGNGSGLTGVNATSLCGIPCADFWQLGGNAGTSPGANFLGTTDNEALELKVNGATALLLQPAAANTVNVAVGPFSGVGLGLSGVTIAGGGNLGGPNLAYENWTTISGGFDQQINSGCSGSVIAGGQSQRILTGSGQAAIGGGYANVIGPGAEAGTIPGGWSNLVSGNYSFAAGNSAQAINSGAFVWADNSGGTFASSKNNQFSARAMGGVSFVTGGAGMTIDGQPVATATGWSLTGNANTTGADFIGTTDNHSLQFAVNGGRAGLLIPFPNGSPSIQWGTVNGVSLSGIGGNVIGGGGYIGAPNLIDASFGVIGGGYENQIYPNAAESVIAGGQGHSIYGGEGVISGGAYNSIDGASGVISGGAFNIITNDGTGCVIPGGENNIAGGDYSFAAGYYAHATQSGSFVWSDGSGTVTTSPAANSATFRASGGYQLFSSTGTAGVQLAPGGGAWTSLSDRNAKRSFEPVNTRTVLDKLAALPVSTWNYKTQDPAIRHIGPTAQDFKAAFAVGESETGITTVDEEGVALAAIKGLNEKLEQSVQAKDAEIHSLQQRLERLENMMRSSPSQP